MPVLRFVGRAIRRALALVLLVLIRYRRAALLAAGLLVVGFAAWTYTHAAPAPTTRMAPAGTVEATIQQVIQRADEEQAQALAAHNPAPMRDTATPSYYQSVALINQQLIDGGVTSIQLDKIEWGPISVSGDTATATAYETWTTTYANGVTDQYRDRNVYTLVRVNGRWLIQADEHPDQPTPTPSG